jgi:hypothetical protein
MSGPGPRRSRWKNGGPIALTALVLFLGYAPLPSKLRAIRQSARSMELNRADREATAGSYYEGLIDGGPAEFRSNLTKRLMGQSPDWVRFHDIGAHYDLEGDFLQFALYPHVDEVAFGARFTTSAQGLRDREYTVAKPEGVFRIVLLGSSIDMGWGVSTDETYENLLEDWLNRRAARLGLKRRFEVLNLAVAAFAPQQRAERFRRDGAKYQPDLVIYGATMLDPRLTDLHLYCLLRDRVDLSDHPQVRQAILDAGVTGPECRLNKDGELVERDAVKKKLRKVLWPVIEQALADLRDQCDDLGVPLAYEIVPRVGKSDAPEARVVPLARHKELADQYARWTLDLSATFDEVEQAKYEIAPWDDHPNARGHDLLFKALAHAIADEPALYETIFGVAP